MNSYDRFLENYPRLGCLSKILLVFLVQPLGWILGLALLFLSLPVFYLIAKFFETFFPLRMGGN